MLIYTLVSIVLLYLIVVLVKDKLYKLTKIKLCAICAAVSLTWLLLIILKLSGYNLDILLIGILMGQSVTGIMYSLQEKIKNKLFLAFSKLAAILLGTAIVYYFLTMI